MRIKHLKIRGFRGFNEELAIDLSDTVAIFEGPNGSGKTSLGEAVEWLLYGKTLKRSKGEELSKREYAGCYKNIHFIGPGPTFVELDVQDLSGKDRKIRRELNTDETSVLQVDETVVSDLREFGIDTMYDRPLILQHTLQDFIFMKPKGRYEVLSAMLGLEPLIAFRNAVEAAKVEFGKKIPQRVSEAQSQRTLILKDLSLEPVLAPVAVLIETGNLTAAKQHLEQVALGLVLPGTSSDGLLVALKTAKAIKEKAQLDWGRFSASVINVPADIPAIRQLALLGARLATLREHLATAIATTSPSEVPAREHDPHRRQFYRLGLGLLNTEHPTNCPFCSVGSLTPERIAAIREAVEDTPAGQSAIQQALTEARALATDLISHETELRRISPSRPVDEDMQKIRSIGGALVTPFLQSNMALGEQVRLISEGLERLKKSQKAVEAALSTGTVPDVDEDLSQILSAYTGAVTGLPALLNGYAANYNLLDSTIRAGLASAGDVKTLDRATQTLEKWMDLVIFQEYRTIDSAFQELIREVRAFTETKQKNVLATRDAEIRNWYAMLNPVRETIDRVTSDGPTLSELMNRLEQNGIRVVPSLQKSGRLNGVSYELDVTRITGSDLGRAYTALGLQTRKGVNYDPERDRVVLDQAARWARENPMERSRPEQGERAQRREERRREYDGLSAAQRATLREIGRFRTVLTEDLVRIRYRGDTGAWRQDLGRLKALGLVKQHSVVIATHSKTHHHAVKALSVVVLTKGGKDLLRRLDPEARAAHQALYAGLVKPREIAHDAAIYRMYQAEAGKIEAVGGNVKRVVLDFELKKRAYSPLAKARALGAAEYARAQTQVAQDNALTIVGGKIRFPDLRIDYETASGDATRVDLELATEHYRGDHMDTKSRAGFKIYADSESFPRFGSGGSDGGAPGLDEDHLIEIFSF